MINVWDYEYSGKVKVTDIDGNVFIGDAQNATEAEERSDLEKKEDGITILSDGKLIEFYVSEIKSIERYKNKL